MRDKAIILIGICAVLLLMPSPNAAGDPVVVWPDSDLLNREAAANLTSWFAAQLGSEIGFSEDPAWVQLNESDLPDFLLAREIYVLPLVDGRVEARYVETGILREVMLRGNTSYFADSTETDDLMEVANRIAIDLGLEDIQAEVNVEREAMLDFGPPGEEQDNVLLEEPTDLGPSLLFNMLSVRVRTSDLRVVSVTLHVFYRALLPPNIDASVAVDNAVQRAESGYAAFDPSATVTGVTVRNATSFVYLINVEWRTSPSDDQMLGGGDGASSWELGLWIDATTGEILHEDGPSLIASGGILVYDFPWMPLALTVSISLAVGLALFYHISRERALDHFTRGRIYGYIQANPGMTFTRVRESLDLKNGTLAYHLWVLERLGFIKSVREGRVRMLYLSGAPVTGKRLVLSRLQYAILDVLRADGPMTQSEIAKQFETSRQRVHYNVKVLRELELIDAANGKVELLDKGEEAMEEVLET
ncbi:MAG: helix-turn-helix domain-containing protein [Thermoplasmata archaeon]